MQYNEMHLLLISENEFTHEIKCNGITSTIENCGITALFGVFLETMKQQNLMRLQLPLLRLWTCETSEGRHERQRDMVGFLIVEGSSREAGSRRMEGPKMRQRRRDTQRRRLIQTENRYTEKP